MARTLEEWLIVGQDANIAGRGTEADPATGCAAEIPVADLRTARDAAAAVMSRSHTHRMRYAFLLRAIALAEAV